MTRPIIAHCWYRSANPSGENVAVERELALLEEGGLRPLRLDRRSDDLLNAGALARVRAAVGLHASPAAVAALARELDGLGGDLLHVHNPWPSLTYGVFEAARSLGLPTIQTLHNYRLVATNTHLLGAHGARRPRDAAERERLAGMPALHGRVANLLYTRALAAYWRRGVPIDAVDAYLCPSAFVRGVMIGAGIPAEKLIVKPNFVAHRGPIGAGPGDYALFVGRLSAEKGFDRLCHAWRDVRLPLHIAGDGPLAHLADGLPGARRLGRLAPDQVLAAMAGARFLVMPSTWYETFGLVLAEAMACATPCLAPRLGAMAEIVEDGVTGRLFAPGDDRDLAASARALWEEAPRLRAACRAAYEARWTPERNLVHLRRIYTAVAAGRIADAAEPSHATAAAAAG